MATSSSQHHINTTLFAHVQNHIPTHLIMATFLTFAAFLLVGTYKGYSPSAFLFLASGILDCSQ